MPSCCTLAQIQSMSTKEIHAQLGTRPQLSTRLCPNAFAYLLGRPSACGCPACGSVLYLPRRCSLRLLLFCTCPPLCAGELWPMPAWVWRDVRFFSPFSL